METEHNKKSFDDVRNKIQKVHGMLDKVGEGITSLKHRAGLQSTKHARSQSCRSRRNIVLEKFLNMKSGGASMRNSVFNDREDRETFTSKHQRSISNIENRAQELGAGEIISHMENSNVTYRNQKEFFAVEPNDLSAPETGVERATEQFWSNATRTTVKKNASKIDLELRKTQSAVISPRMDQNNQTHAIKAMSPGCFEEKIYNKSFEERRNAKLERDLQKFLQLSKTSPPCCNQRATVEVPPLILPSDSSDGHARLHSESSGDETPTTDGAQEAAETCLVISPSNSTVSTTTSHFESAANQFVQDESDEEKELSENIPVSRFSYRRRLRKKRRKVNKEDILKMRENQRLSSSSSSSYQKDSLEEVKYSNLNGEASSQMSSLPSPISSIATEDENATRRLNIEISKIDEVRNNISSSEEAKSSENENNTITNQQKCVWSETPSPTKLKKQPHTVSPAIQEKMKKFEHIDEPPICDIGFYDVTSANINRIIEQVSTVLIEDVIACELTKPLATEVQENSNTKRPQPVVKRLLEELTCPMPSEPCDKLVKLCRPNVPFHYFPLQKLESNNTKLRNSIEERSTQTMIRKCSIGELCGDIIRNVLMHAIYAMVGISLTITVLYHGLRSKFTSDWDNYIDRSSNDEIAFIRDPSVLFPI